MYCCKSTNYMSVSKQDLSMHKSNLNAKKFSTLDKQPLWIQDAIIPRVNVNAKQNVLPAGTLKPKNVTYTFYEEKKAVEDKLQSNQVSVIAEEKGKLMIISASCLRAVHIVQMKHEKIVRASACVFYVCVLLVRMCQKNLWLLCREFPGWGK